MEGRLARVEAGAEVVARLVRAALVASSVAAAARMRRSWWGRVSGLGAGCGGWGAYSRGGGLGQLDVGPKQLAGDERLGGELAARGGVDGDEGVPREPEAHKGALDGGPWVGGQHLDVVAGLVGRAVGQLELEMHLQRVACCGECPALGDDALHQAFVQGDAAGLGDAQLQLRPDHLRVVVRASRRARAQCRPQMGLLPRLEIGKHVTDGGVGGATRRQPLPAGFCEQLVHQRRDPVECRCPVSVTCCGAVSRRLLAKTPAVVAYRIRRPRTRRPPASPRPGPPAT